MKLNSQNPGKRRITAVAMSVLMAAGTFSFASAGTLPDNVSSGIPAGTGIESSGQLGSPWAVKAKGKVVAYVKTEEAGRNVVEGLKIHYYNDVQMQQDAKVEPLVTVSKVTKALPAGTKVMSVKEAVDHIAAMNKDDTPVIQVSYSSTLKETKSIKPKKKIIKTAELEKGEKKVETEGESGSKYVESSVTQVNSKVVDKDVMKSTVVEKPETEVVYEGTALSSENKGKAIVAFAKKYLGNKYVWGGESLEKGVDCSGYMMKLYEHYGVSLPHSSSAQGSCGKEVSHDEMQAGDLIIYPGHVAMYMGNGMIIHAAGESVGIITSDESSYAGKIKHIRRIFGTDLDGSTDSMFPDVSEIAKAYEADKGFGDGDGYAEDYSSDN